MCLTYIDEIKKVHLVGIKLVHETSNKNKFASTVYGTVYTIDEWFDAGSILPEVESTSINGKKIKYLAGSHYYRTLKNLFIPENSVILKVRVRGVIATGIQDGVEAGVCRNLLPVCILPKPNPKKIKVGDLKELIKITNCKCLIDIFNRARTIVPTIEQIKAANEFITKSKEQFVKCICFIDHFERDSSFFKFYTRVHFVLASPTRSIKASIYQKLYHSMIQMDSDMVKIEKQCTSKIQKMNIPRINVI
jgi:hypothetical protein